MASMAPPLARLFFVAGCLAGTAHADPVTFTVIDGRSVPAPLGGLEGDPKRGAALAEAHCARCHGGDDAIAAMAPGRARLATIDLAMTGRAVENHAFYVPTPEGTTVLSAQDVEDIVAWLGQRAP
jgi:mono/diheme cytochrome c family protein